MPIATAFGVTSLIALIMLVLFLIRVERRRRLYKASGRNGDGLRAAAFLVRLVGVRTFDALLLTLAALGAFVPPLHFLLYGIALIPVTWIASTFVDLRDL